MSDISEIEERVQSHGLVVLATLEGTESWEGAGHIVLVGNAGSSIWPAFTRSPENKDGRPNPLDRWSKRIGTALAADLDADVVFPFEGPPYAPVLDWARKGGQAYPSPISMFIHGKYGLWHAYRFALLLHRPLDEFPAAPDAAQPCLSCMDQPCLTACPVDAFAIGKYHVDDCVSYLAGDEHSGCRELGCAARRACPVGTRFHYEPDHARFHMDAFLASQTSSEI